MSLRVLHVAATYVPSTAYGGPSISLHAGVQAERAAGVDSQVVTTDADGDLAVPAGKRLVDGVPVTYCRSMPLNQYGLSPGLFAEVLRKVREFDILHAHGTALPSATAALWLGALSGKGLVVSPRGSLMAWARRQKPLRKRAYALLDRWPRSRALARATSAEEERDLAGCGFAQTCLVPNGIDLAALAAPSALDARASFGLPPGCRLAVSVSRFNPVKNLELLLEATHGLGLELVLAGDAESDYGRRMQRLAAEQRRVDVHFVGHVEGEPKRALLQQADLFLSSSHMESYGLAIAEALAAGTPVVASTGTPWSELDAAGAGRWVPPTGAAFREAMLDLLGRGAGARAAARTLAQAHSQERSGALMIGHYERLLSGRGRP